MVLCLADDSITVDDNGNGVLCVDVRYDISHSTHFYHCGSKICHTITYTGSYTTKVEIHWGDGSATEYHYPEYPDYPDNVSWTLAPSPYPYFSLHCWPHEFPEGIFHVWGYEYYKFVGGTERKRRFDLYNVDGTWVKWYADCGDTVWTGNADLCAWNGNYGIVWDSNNFTIPLSQVYTYAKATNIFLSIFGLAVETLFDMWFGEDWLETKLADKYFPWMSNWSYWMSNNASIYPWNWWWTNWAPGFSGPGRIGVDIEGVYHGIDDPLSARDICNRNASATEITGGFSISWLGYPEPLHVGQTMYIYDESVGMEKLLYSFGDDTGSNTSDREPEYRYGKPGTYVITQMGYPKASIQQTPIYFTRTVTVGSSIETFNNCSIWPCPDGWSLNAAINALRIEVMPGDVVRCYLSSDSGCGCDVATVWSGEWGLYDYDHQIYTENDANFLHNWSVSFIYNQPGRWKVKALFRDTENNTYTWASFSYVYVLGENGEVPDPWDPEDEEDDFPDNPEDWPEEWPEIPEEWIEDWPDRWPYPWGSRWPSTWPMPGESDYPSTWPYNFPRFPTSVSAWPERWDDYPESWESNWPTYWPDPWGNRGDDWEAYEWPSNWSRPGYTGWSGDWPVFFPEFPWSSADWPSSWPTVPTAWLVTWPTNEYSSVGWPNPWDDGEWPTNWPGVDDVDWPSDWPYFGDTDDEEEIPYPLPVPPADKHRYLRLTGDDDNDGLTWDTAFKTWKRSLNDIPDGGWLHVDLDDYRHQQPVDIKKNIVIIPQEDFRDVGNYKSIVLPAYGAEEDDDDGWWPFW